LLYGQQTNIITATITVFTVFEYTCTSPLYHEWKRKDVDRAEDFRRSLLSPSSSLSEQELKRH